MVKAIVLVKSPKKLIAARLKRVNLVYESFPVNGQFDAVAVIEVENLSQIKDITTEIQKIQNLLDRSGGRDSFGNLRFEMGEVMNTHLAVYRNQEGIEQAVSKLVELKDRYERVIVDDKGKIFNTNLLIFAHQFALNVTWHNCVLTKSASKTSFSLGN